MRSSFFIRKIALVFSSILLLYSFSNAQEGAYYTNEYRNLFSEVLNKTDAEINQKVDAAFNQVFYGGANEKLYYETGTDMAYIVDINNNDVRSEGMSYGMMICVQLNKQEEFDKLWKWTKTYMQHSSGYLDGFFRWQLSTNGDAIDNNPAPDGEAYFITALFFAAHRWGNGTGIFDYEAEAQSTILKVQSKTGAGGINNLFNTNSRLITFGPNGGSYDFTDPSYHLPGFLEVWSMWSDTNQEFWAQTPAASRIFLQNASHPTSGLTSDYSEFDGTPKEVSFNSDADLFMYDAWRTAMNIGMDYHWFAADPQQPIIITRLLNFFQNQGSGYPNHYNWDGSNPNGSHDVGLVACNAAACLAIDDATLAEPFVQEFWNAPLPTGTYRYYSGMLYMLSLLHCSGNFKIYKADNGPEVIVSISTPRYNDNFETPARIEITADAISTEGTITNVEFYNGTELLGSDDTETYSFTWENVEAGTYTIEVVATDDAGLVGSDDIIVTVSPPSLMGEITVRATGFVGDELIELEIDGQIVQEWTLSTSYDDYTTQGNVNGVIRINYTNDDGQDRDAQIDYIIVAGTTYEAEDQAINTGYYANDACGGGSHNEMMHCSGYIEFETDPVTITTPDADTVQLYAGWNIIGCPIEGTTPVESALSSIWDYVIIVKNMEIYNDPNNALPALNSLTELEWGKGYLVKVSEDCTLDWIAR